MFEPVKERIRDLMKEAMVGKWGILLLGGYVMDFCASRGRVGRVWICWWSCSCERVGIIYLDEVM